MTLRLTLVRGGVLALALAVTPAMAEEPTADTVVAVVNGTQITLGHMLAAREALPEQYKTLPPDALYKGILDQLIQQTVLEQSMEGKITRKDQLDLENTRRGAISSFALQAVVKAAVTDEAVKAAYDAKYAKAPEGTEYHAAHILVADEAKAKELLTQLEGGADFAELAKANSTDTGSGAAGGDLGWFGLGMMVKPFEEAVVGATPGKVVGPVKTDFGYHLILVRETRPAQAPKLEDVSADLAAELEQKAVEDHIKTLVDAAKVDRPGDALDPALITKIELLQ